MDIYISRKHLFSAIAGFTLFLPLLSHSNIDQSVSPSPSEAKGLSGSPVVMLSTEQSHCSGTLVSPFEIITAAHCLPEEGDLKISIRSDEAEEPCLTGVGPGGQCSPKELKFKKAINVDVAVVYSDSALTQLPREYPLLSSDKPEAFKGIAIDAALESEAPVSTQSNFIAQYSNDDSIITRAPNAVCAGSSGMGAFTRKEGKLHLHGVMTSSQASAENPECASAGQVLHFAAGEAITNLLAQVRGAELEAVELPDVSLEEAIDALGESVIAFSDTPPSLLEKAPEAGAIQVGVASPQGHGTAWLRAESVTELAAHNERGSVKELSAIDVAGGVDGDMLIPRAISNNTDSRGEYFVQEVGRVMAGGSRCTGTLIGPRLVRTAAHCIVGKPWPTFQLQYHGGARTTSYDGWRTSVTHRAKSAFTYYYGGRWNGLDCENTFYSKGYDHFKQCLAQDWAIIILPSNVWSDIGVTPRYMGYSVASRRTVKNTGYPNCRDVTSRSITNCVEGRMYGQNYCFAQVVSTNGSSVWHSCDTTVGHSGGPIFYNSGSANYLIGSHSSGDPNACAGTQCPSAATGTDSWLYNFMNSLRSQYR